MNMVSRIDWAMGEGRERRGRRTEEEKRGQTKTGLAVEQRTGLREPREHVAKMLGLYRKEGWRREGKLRK